MAKKTTAKKTEPTGNATAPVRVILPNHMEKKLSAIWELSRTVRILAEALTSCNVQVTVSDCVFHEITSGCGLKIETSEWKD